MTANQLFFRDEVHGRIRCGLDALAEATQVALGPRGRTVILDRDHGWPQIADSGVLAAKSVKLEHWFENRGAHQRPDRQRPVTHAPAGHGVACGGQAGDMA
jgi:chaperonin GroEL